MILHEIGPYTVSDGSLIYEDYIINEPTILIDVDSDMKTLLKVGNKDFVTNYYNTMVAKYTARGWTNMTETLTLIILDNTQMLSTDDICTVINAALNCTGHPILDAMVANDVTKLHDEIIRLQEIGY